MKPSPATTAPARRRPATAWWLSLGLTLVGLGVSIYLTWVKLTDNLAACGPIGDCESVNSSRYAEIAGIPIALLGALAYVAVLALLGAERWLPRQAENLNFGVFGIGLIGTLYSAYLTYIEVAVLRAVCPYCVVSAVAVTAIFIISIARMRAADGAA
jgi:uncharacterized membrane protein